jgi:hypothetical protein
LTRALATSGENILKDYPLILKHDSTVNSHEKVKAYYDSKKK